MGGSLDALTDAKKNGSAIAAAGNALS